MPGFADEVRKVFWWVSPTAKAFGLVKPIAAIFVSLGLGLWAMIDHMPWSIIAAVLFTTFVSMIYLLLFPAMVRQLAGAAATQSAPRPDLSMYRHHESFSLRQADCLLAERTPTTPYPSEEARNWADAISAAIKSNSIARIVTPADDANNTYPYAGGTGPMTTHRYRANSF